MLVPADMKKIQTVLSRSCGNEYILHLVLKQLLSDKSVANKQHIRPSLVNKALEKLVEINPFYKYDGLNNSWEDVSKESDQELWELLADEKVKSKTVEETGSEEDVDSSNNTIENQSEMSSVPYLTALHEIDGPSVSQNQIIDISLREAKILFFFSVQNLIGKLQIFQRNVQLVKINEPRAVPVVPTKYVHTRLKCCDGIDVKNLHQIVNIYSML